MERLEFQPSAKTPYILLDPSGKIQFRGRSIPENVASCYEHILTWMEGYFITPAPETTVDIEMEYLNSGTSKYILKILKIVKDIESKGLKIKVNWFFEEGDDDIMERGEYYAAILDIKINLIETE